MNEHNLLDVNSEESLVLRQFSLFPSLSLTSKYAEKWFKSDILTSLVDKGLLVKGKTDIYKRIIIFDDDKPSYKECIKLIDVISTDLNFGPTEAFKSRLEILPIAEKVAEYFSDTKNEQIANLIHNMAVLYNKQANYNKALDFYEKALEIRENKLGEEHPHTASTYNGKAEVYLRQANYNEALKFYEKALEIRENKLGEEDPDIATTYDGIAEVYKNATYDDITEVYGKQVNYDKALDFYEKALEIRENKLGEEHPYTASTYNGKAMVFFHRGNEGDNDKALECCEKALNICKKVLDKEHPYTASMYNNIALVYISKDDYDNALEHFGMALNIHKKNLGEKHPYTIIAYSNIAYCYYVGKKDYRNAMLHYCKAGKEILEALCYFKNEDKKEAVKVLFEDENLVDDYLKIDVFFGNIVSNLNMYREVYVQSVYITSLLHINDDNEKEIAYYAKKNVAEKMFFKEGNEKVNAFRLNSINYSNDPKEGTILLEYLFENKININQFENSYRAFAGCFTFNHDSLNQFRLYGKENDQECTGVSIIFKDNFFGKTAKTATSKLPMKADKDKHALFRCIYIDLDEKTDKKVVSVGHKEDFLFHKDKVEISAIKDYNKKIAELIEQVSVELEELKKLVKNLDPEIVGKLLINLRYLIKHVAFKEEQECRILRIEDIIDNNDVKTSESKKQMYLEYLEIEPHVEKIYFAPNTSDMNIFQDRLLSEGKKIKCIKSKNPFTGVNYDV